jgi:outer membrane protein OmpA-like peptidoglycan-associated protein
MMDADDTADGNELSDDQLDIVLASADEELLEQVRARADPTAILTELMTSRTEIETGPDAPDTLGTADYPRCLTYGRRSGPRRSWRTVGVSVAAAAALAALAILVSSIIRGRQPNPVTSAGSHPKAVIVNYQQGHWVISDPVPRAAPLGVNAREDVNISASLLFSSGQSELSASADAQLNRLLHAQKLYSGSLDVSSIISVAINGYAEEQRGSVYDKILSWERAKAVGDWLIDHHVPGSELHATVRSDAAQRDHVIKLRDNRVTVIITIHYHSPVMSP